MHVPTLTHRVVWEEQIPDQDAGSADSRWVFFSSEEVKPLILNSSQTGSSVLTLIEEGIWDFPKSPWNPDC